MSYSIPKSAWLVAKELTKGEATLHELHANVNLAYRTIRYALKRLAEIDVIQQRQIFAKDMRQIHYKLKPGVTVANSYEPSIICILPPMIVEPKT
jgi:predicted transcriptional regulator